MYETDIDIISHVTAIAMHKFHVAIFFKSLLWKQLGIIIIILL